VPVRRRSRLLASRRQRLQLAVTALAACIALVTGAVRWGFAGSCLYPLALGDVVARPAIDGGVLELTGVWEYENLLQVRYGLDLSIVVFQPDGFFVRYKVGGNATTGIAPNLSTTPSATDISFIEGSGTGVTEAEILTFEPNFMRLSLPPTVVEGSVFVFAYLTLNFDVPGSLISNTVGTRFDADGDGKIKVPAAGFAGARAEVGS
jgi:hypothetical protein